MGRKILVADLLCGAGGSSTGCARALAALGLEMELVCVNHWPVAIDTHTRNHPHARHYCQDISAVRPHLVVPEGYLDLLMASPSCTHHSVARGGKPTSDQQRSDPWHIITWLTELRVKRIIIENVWEFTNWGPVDARTGKPIKSRKGEYFNAWIDTIRRLGFEPEWRKLNAADFGEATTRQRFILMARSDRRRVVWPVATHAKRVDGLDLFPGVKQWRPAREIIDWSIRGRSIFDRKKPLAAKTLARIYAGAVKFNWPESFLVKLRNHMAVAAGEAPAPAVPWIRSTRQDTGGPAPRSVEDPIATATATDSRFALVEPFVISRHGEGAPRSVDEPTPTQVAKHSHCLISPYYGSGSGETCISADEPLPTVTAKGRFGMVVPITHADGSNRARDVDAAPLPTLTTANRGEQALVEGTPQFDILFRMLEPHELAAAMGFDSDDSTYEFAGTKTEKVKQIGNAVAVNMIRACVAAIMADDAVPTIVEAAE